MAKKNDKKKKINEKKYIALNKKASFNYFILDTFIAGIVLCGTEIKSIRAGKVSINEAFCLFSKKELFVYRMFIAKYDFCGFCNHEEYRVRKLLLNKNEILKLKNQKNKNLAIVPTKIFINDRGFAKMEIALVKGKKLYDKRQAIKEKDMNRKQQLWKY